MFTHLLDKNHVHIAIKCHVFWIQRQSVVPVFRMLMYNLGQKYQIIAILELDIHSYKRATK